MAINFSTYRTTDIDDNLRKMQIRPLDVMVTGVTGAGKSTTLNAFFKELLLKLAMVSTLKLWNWMHTN